MNEKFLEIIFKPGESKENSIEELTFTLERATTNKCYRIALNIALLKEIDYLYIITLVALLSEYESKGVKFALLGVDLDVQAALTKAYINESIQVYEQRKLFFSSGTRKISHTHIMGSPIDQFTMSAISGDTDYFDDPTCCSIAGQYECSSCGTHEYFMKGVTFEPCCTEGCKAHILDWTLIETLF